MSRHASQTTVVAYTRRTGDGVAHLAYFDAPSGLSFVWTGNPADPIEVSPGGYAEPITNVIRTRAGTQQPLAEALAEYLHHASIDGLASGSMALAVTHWYSHVCAEWVAHITEHGGAEPPVVREEQS